MASTSGLRAADTRTFHSSPVTCAEWVRFDEPTYAVEKPERRWNIHAFAWSRVVLDVVGDPHLGPELGEPVERPPFRRAVYVVVRTRSGSPVLAMSAERIEQRAIPLRRMNAITTSISSADSISERSWLHKRRLARRVGQQRRVEQRDERHIELRHTSVRPAPRHSVKNGSRSGGPLGEFCAQRLEFGQPLDEGTSNSEPYLDTPLIGDVEERSLDLLADVPRDPVGDIAALKMALVHRQLPGHLVELSPQALRDEDLVQPGPQLRHAATLPSRSSFAGRSSTA